MVATSPEHMPETRQEVRNGREPRVPAPAWDNSPPSGRSAAVAYLLWEQVVAGSIPAAPTKPSRELALSLPRREAPPLGYFAETPRAATKAGPDTGGQVARARTSPPVPPTPRHASAIRHPVCRPKSRFLSPRTRPVFDHGCRSSLAKPLTALECARFRAEKGDASQEV